MKKEFEEDFDSLIKFLKNNSPYSHLINFDNIIKQKEKIINSKSKAEFFNNLTNCFYDCINPSLLGHNWPIIWSKDFYKGFYKNGIDENKQNPHYKLLKNINYYSIEDFKKSSFYKNNFLNNNKNNKKSFDKIYYYKIIKDDKNNDCIYIYIPKMINPNDEEINNLYSFIKKHKNLDNIYIDIRNNGGGNTKCYQKLLFMIYKGELIPYKNNIKLYFKYTKYNKIWYDYYLKDTKKYKSNNKNFSHYIIQKLNNRIYKGDNDYFIKSFKNIFIIMNKKNFSSSQIFLDDVKGNKGFTILGDEKSSGHGRFGNYSKIDNTLDPFYYILPNTKILFMYERFYCNWNNLFTTPDKPIPSFLKNILFKF